MKNLRNAMIDREPTSKKENSTATDQGIDIPRSAPTIPFNEIIKSVNNFISTNNINNSSSIKKINS